MSLWRSGRSHEGKATQVDGKAVGPERAVSREHSRRPGAHFTEKRLLLYPRRCWRTSPKRDFEQCGKTQ